MLPALRMLPLVLTLSLVAGTGPGRADAAQPAVVVVTHGSTAFDSGRPLLDINSASTDALTLLKGVGPARAAAIIKGRPYESAVDLRDREIVPEAVYEAIKGRIIALPPR